MVSSIRGVLMRMAWAHVSLLATPTSTEDAR